MKQFNLESAKNGAPVMTRDGSKVRILCFDLQDTTYPILAAVTKTTNNVSEQVWSYRETGKVRESEGEYATDLLMAPIKKEKWINLYKESGYETEEEADANADKYGARLDCVKVEWEE